MTPQHEMAWCAVMALGMTGCALLGILIGLLWGPALWAIIPWIGV